MKTPEFKPSVEFISELVCPCMLAILRNSAVPGLATRYISKKGKDPAFEIFLRGKNPNEVSAWQKGILERLFEKGELIVAIERGMKEYEEQLDGAAMGGDEEDWEDMKRYEFLPHVTLRAIVVDDIKCEVILSLSTESDGNLAEHGIAICLKKGRWRFNQDDYLNDYCSAIRSEEVEKRWESANSPSTSKVVIESNPTFLWGIWEFDEQEARKISKQLWASNSEMERDIKSIRGYRIEISESRFALATQHTARCGLMAEFEFVGSELRGDKVEIRFQNLGAKTAKDGGVMNFIWQNNLLISPHGKLVLKRKNLQSASGKHQQRRVQPFQPAVAGLALLRRLFKHKHPLRGGKKH
jgi:hypothetical protein